MINLRTEIKDNLVYYKWDKRIKGIKGKSLYFLFESDLSGIPEHVFNFMFGVFMMDGLTYTGQTLGLTELSEAEELHLNNILRINHRSRGCAGRAHNNKAPGIYARDQPRALPPSHDNDIICANGMGKDGLNVALLTKEMGYSPFCFTLINQYWRNSKLWPERYDSIMEFYREEDIDQTFIKTNFFKIKSEAIGFYPYAVGLPLAYLKNTNVIQDGIQIHSNKTRLSDGSFYCPGETHVVFDQFSRGTGITLSSPLRAISNFGSEKLLFDKWPRHIKYQRSCMFGFPWCGECSKCNRKSLYMELLGFDHDSIGLPHYVYDKVKLDSYMAVDRSVKQVLNKINGQPYENWIEGANETVLAQIWNGDKIRDILSEHFHIYTEDPGPDGDGFTLEPSRWREYKDAQPVI